MLSPGELVPIFSGGDILVAVGETHRKEKNILKGDDGEAIVCKINVGKDE